MVPPIISGRIDRLHLDTLRGIACLLLVGYHTSADAMSYTAAGNEQLSLIHAVLTPIRMPLFSFLSGFIYAYRPASGGTLGKFFSGKVRRILVPFAVITAVIMAMKTALPSGNGPTLSDLPYHLVYPFSHLWFLPAIFIAVSIHANCDALFPSHKRAVAMSLFAASLLVYFWVDLRSVGFLAIGQAFYLLPFFTFGVLANRFSSQVLAARIPLALLCLPVAIGALWLAYPEAVATGEISRLGLLGLFASLSSLIVLFLVAPSSRYLAKLGAYSFTIYLLHSIFSAVALRLGPQGLAALLPFVFIAALLGPIVAEIALKRFFPSLCWAIGVKANARPRKESLSAAE